MLKLRQVEVLQCQGGPDADAIRQIGVTPHTYHRRRKENGGMSHDQLKRLKPLETEDQRLRRAVSDQTLDRLVLTEGARGVRAVLETALWTVSGLNGRSPRALPGEVGALIICPRALADSNAGLAHPRTASLHATHGSLRPAGPRAADRPLHPACAARVHTVRHWRAGHRRRVRT